MESIEVEASSVDEAIERALSRLGKTQEEVEIVILSRGRRGFLGIGAKQAKVIVTPHRRPTDQPSGEEITKVAKEVLAELLTAMGMEAQVNVYDSFMQPMGPRSKDFNIDLDITSDEAAILIGREGKTLDALEYITRLIVGQRLRRRILVNVDVDGYRARHRRFLRRLAVEMADKVRYSGEAEALPAMPPQERKVIHQTLQSDPGVTTKSIGEDEGRQVVILPN